VDPAGAVHHHVVAIGGLAPGNRYGYQVGDGARLVANATFASAAPPGQSFSFAAIGDFGRGGAGELQNATLIASAGTSFVQTLGDNVYPAAGEPDPDFVHVYGDFDAWLYKPFATVFREQPLYPANGNKEYYSDGEFWQNVPMPGSNHSWYAYDWGDAHVLVLDSNRPTGPGSAQYAFARSDLAAHQASAWRIVVIHQPLYSSTTPRSSSPALRAALAPLFQQQRVDLVLSGNVHNYERTRPLIDGRPAEGGVTYVVSGGGGNGLNPITLPKPAYSAFREAVYYEFVRVTVTPGALVVDAIRADTGGVFDTATIGRR
jgi:hypothetical protein